MAGVPEHLQTQNQRDIVVTTHGHDVYTEELIRQIEARLDEVLGHIGFTRKTTTFAADKTEFVYYQFAMAMGPGKIATGKGRNRR